MTGPRRVNFAYVGPPPKEWTAHLKWSARILRLAGEEVPEQELLAELDREDRELQTRRPVGHRVLPDSRRHPDQQELVLLSPDLDIPLKTKQGIDLHFWPIQCVRLRNRLPVDRPRTGSSPRPGHSFRLRRDEPRLPDQTWPATPRPADRRRRPPARPVRPVRRCPIAATHRVNVAGAYTRPPDSSRSSAASARYAATTNGSAGNT